MKHFEKLAHAFLIFGFLLGSVAILRLRYDAAGEFRVILALTLFYLVWGIFYHNVKGDFNKKLFLEYLLIAAIAAVAAFGVFAS